jgi:hypothetical protein
MTVLIELRPAASARPWEADCIPYVYDEASRVQFGAMPGVRWVPSRTAPNGRGFYRGPLEALRIVAATLESAGVVKVTESAELHAAGAAQPVTPDPRLRGYQADGVSWLAWQLRASGGAMLADEMGLGKTVQAIVALDALAPAGLRLVLCPAVVVDNWQHEIAKWAIEPERYTIRSFDTWRNIIKKGEGRGPWASVILDELHKVSNPKSQQSQAVAATLAGSPLALRLGLTGTPMTTSPADLWHPLELLHSGRWGKAFTFQKRYCGGKFVELTNDDGSPMLRNGEPMKSVWQATGATRQAELAARLGAVMLRRTKAQVGAELPPRTRSIIEVNVAAAARKADRRAALLLDGSGALSSLLREVEPHKLATAEALARDCMASGSRPLLLTTRRSSAALLGEALGCPSVTGEDSQAERRAALQGAPCGVATLYSVEVGVNYLTGYDVIIFCGLDWVPSRILQAESRIHRIGQDNPVTIYYLIAKGTIDEVIRDRVIQRLETFAALTAGGAGDEAGLAGDLKGGGDEESLLAGILSAVKEAA